MADREGKEIVLGNKQLLSFFFIVAILVGIAFTMGYMIGKNTVSAASAGAPLQAAPRPAAQRALPENNSSEAPATDPADTEPAHPAKPAKNRTASPPAADSQAHAKAAPESSSSVAQGTPAAHGSYLQLAALKREDADHLVAVLRKRGFPALLGESPKEGLFRVLVGPFSSMPDLADSKQKLRASGFDSIVAR